MARIGIVLVGLVLFAVLAWWSLSHYRFDIQSDIQGRAQEALLAEAHDAVIATADGRNVTLTGFSADASGRVDSERIVTQLRGVRAVNNQIKIGSPANLLNNSSKEPTAEDAVVSFLLSVASRGDGLHLTGTVSDQQERARIAAQADAIYIGTVVHNRLEVGAPALSNSSSLIGSGLSVLSEFISGTMDVDQRGLRINGSVASDEKRRLIEQRLVAVNAELPELSFETNITVAERLADSDCQAELNRLIASEKILFGNEKAVVAEESHGLLNAMASVIRRCGSGIEIGGHTDARGDDSYNQWLSEQRATAVQSYLLAQGVPELGLSAVGYGETQPIESNDTRAQRAKNRRIEFRVVENQQ